MELRRVVITGLGVLSPLGNDVATVWQNLIAGTSGAGSITHFDASKFKTQFACEVKNFDASSFLDVKEQRKMDLFTQYAIFSALQAFKDSGINMEKENADKIGVIWGSGMGGFGTLQEAMIDYAQSDGTPHFSPFLIPRVITNIAPGHISILLGLRGVNFNTTSACSSSAHALACAYDQICLGRADLVLTGGSEAPIEKSGVGGFNALHALSTRNDDAARASRPFSKSRDGFVLGEGAACLVLEEYEHAVARGAKIYAEVAGVGFSADAYHMTAPEPNGTGAALVMSNALREANIQPEQVDYINTHGTSTPLGDIAEVKAIEQVWGEKAKEVNISSTKSMTGHMMGAAGAFEALATVLAVKNDIIPPTINHAEDDVDEQLNPELNFTFNTAQHRCVNYAISNSFGFGGHNTTLVFKKVK